KKASACAVSVEVGVVVSLFFLAVVGIRVGHVTGVQTCALPILFCRVSDRPAALVNVPGPLMTELMMLSEVVFSLKSGVKRAVVRSEERRVGKECGSRWSLEAQALKVSVRVVRAMPPAVGDQPTA